MAHTSDTVFSNFFLKQIGFIIGSSTFSVDCVGKLSLEIEMKTITKSCRGRVKKRFSKPIGGTATTSLHCPYDVKIAIFNYLEQAAGVYGYGSESKHPTIIVTALVEDEEGNVKYLAFPSAVADTDSIDIDDDAEEVAMDEIAFNLGVDDNEMIYYQALADDIDSAIADSWMTGFSADLVAAMA